MNTNKNRAAQTPRWLRALGIAIDNAFTRIKLWLGHTKNTLSATTSSNLINLQPRDTEEQKNVGFDGSYLFMLPPGIRNRFLNLANASNPPLLNHAGNHSILAVLNINNIYFWGASNNSQSLLSPRDLNDLRSILKYERYLSTYYPFLAGPEADAILQAFKQKMTANRATMFIERKECNVCGRREFDARCLRQLMPILSLKELTVYTTNSIGIMSKLVLSPLLASKALSSPW